MSYLRHRVLDIRYRMYIRCRVQYQPTMSYVPYLRFRIYLWTYNIVYYMYYWWGTISYVWDTMSYVNIRCCQNRWYSTYDIVCLLPYIIHMNRRCDLTYNIVYHTTSYVPTYDIVGDLQHRRWQESRCNYMNYMIHYLPGKMLMHSVLVADFSVMTY